MYIYIYICVHSDEKYMMMTHTYTVCIDMELYTLHNGVS